MAWIVHPVSSLPNVLAAQEGNSALVRTCVAFYRQLMFAPSSLTRRERELVATAVSAINHCFY